MKITVSPIPEEKSYLTAAVVKISGDVERKFISDEKALTCIKSQLGRATRRIHEALRTRRPTKDVINGTQVNITFIKVCVRKGHESEDMRGFIY